MDESLLLPSHLISNSGLIDSTWGNLDKSHPRIPMPELTSTSLTDKPSVIDTWVRTANGLAGVPSTADLRSSGSLTVLKLRKRFLHLLLCSGVFKTEEYESG